METKTLIAVISCRSRLQTWVKAIRETWLPLVPVHRADVKFFVGRGEGSVPEDAVVLDCDDSYMGLPEKVRAMARWAVEYEYDFALKNDDDVILRPAALLSSGYEKHEYSGKANRPPQPYTVPFGFNYFLSKKCLKIVAEAELPETNDDEKWVAKNLWDHGIELHDDPRYCLHSQLMTPIERRPLRAPKRDIPNFAPEPEYLSRCIHLPYDEDVKLAEFKRVYHRYGGQ